MICLSVEGAGIPWRRGHPRRTALQCSTAVLARQYKRKSIRLGVRARFLSLEKGCVVTTSRLRAHRTAVDQNEASGWKVIED